jgi:NAD(P)-dependent dehydrogenase (short-subunit alcohol dehydrogenase family)
MSTAQEVAELVIYLASDKAAYITGGSVDISGGLDMH